MTTVNIKATSSDEELSVANRIDSLAVHKARLEKSKEGKGKEKEMQDMNAPEEKDTAGVHVDGRVDSITLAKQRMGLSGARPSNHNSRFAKRGPEEHRSSLTGSISSLGRRIVRSLSIGSGKSKTKSADDGDN